MTPKALLSLFAFLGYTTQLVAQNVGIGTTTPKRTFVVRNDSTAVNTVVTELASSNGGDPNFHLVTTKGEASNAGGAVMAKIGMLYGDANANHNSYIRFHRGPTGAGGGFMSFTTNTDIERMRIGSTGNVGIGTTASTVGEKLGVSNGETELAIFPGYKDGVVNKDYTTIDMAGDKYLRIWDHLSVSGNSYVDDTLITNNIRIGSGVVSANSVLQSDAVGNGFWAPITVAETDPQVSSGLTFKVPKWNGSTLVDGIMYDNGYGIGIANTLPQGQLHVKSIGLTEPAEVDEAQITSTNLIGGPNHWQSFTARTTGYLAKVELQIQSPGMPNIGYGLILLRSGQGTGGPIISSVSIIIQPLSNTFQTFYFLSPPPITAGAVYTIEFNAGTTTNTWAYVNMNNPYAGGRADIGTGADYLFKTYVAGGELADGLVVNYGNVGIGKEASRDFGKKLSVRSLGVDFNICPGMLDDDAAPNWTTLDIAGSSNLRIWDNLSVAGDVGIGARTPKSKLEVAGKISALGYATRTGGTTGQYENNTYFNFSWDGGSVNAWIDNVWIPNGVTSDRRLKDQINPLANGAISTIMQLKPVSFHYKDVPNSIFKANPVIQDGFIADELETVIPSAVKGKKDAVNEEGKIVPQGVNALPIVSVLTKAVQEQQKLIEAQQKQINELLKRLENLDKGSRLRATN
jgi:Chaperone of endosialidase